MGMFDVDGRRSFKALLRDTFHSTLYVSGLSDGFLRYKQPHAAIVLMYHSVADRDSREWVDPRWTMSAADFEGQLDFLSRERRVISLEQLISDIQERRPIPAGTVVLTFDDGYRDNLTVVAPLLRRYKLPASFFIPTSYMDEGNNMWVDKVYNAFRLRTRHSLQLALLGEEAITLGSQAQARATFHRLNDLLIYIPHPEREQVVEEIIAQLQPSQLTPRLVMNWEELRRLRRDFPEITIGAHTSGHDPLDHTERQTIVSEVDQSLCDLKREADISAKLFSFPYSRSSDVSRAYLAEAGLDGAVGGGSLVVDHSADVYNLGRLDPRVAPTQFRYKTSGAFPTLMDTLRGRA